LNRWLAPTIAEAIEQAKRFVDGHDIELWSGDRLVTRLETKTK
jgi:hypothetical protein